MSSDPTPYTSSAHGNSVNRSSIAAFGYAQGNCTHCHEQKASIGGTEPAPASGSASEFLCYRTQFANQEGGFCVNCHKDPSVSSQISMPNQYDYSWTRGGETTKTCPGHILKAFKFIDVTTRLPTTNCSSSIGSAHDLTNIRNQMINTWGWGSTNAEVNPCCTCHTPHRQTSDYPCTLPSGHANESTWEIWGDDSDEKMDDYTTLYQPPNKAGGGTERDASTQPDYVTLCLECHSTSRNSKQHGTVAAINWDSDVHGKAARDNTCDWEGNSLLPPYNNGQSNYVLCCTDCHEPHGSRNQYLLRTCVNGKTGIAITSSLYWWDFCTACHTNPSHVGPQNDCLGGGNCHLHGKQTICGGTQKTL